MIYFGDVFKKTVEFSWNLLSFMKLLHIFVNKSLIRARLKLSVSKQKTSLCDKRLERDLQTWDEIKILHSFCDQTS